MYYEELKIGTTTSSFKIVTEIDFAGMSPLMWAASHAETLFKKLIGPGYTLLSFSASFANEPKLHDRIDTAMTVRGFHPTRKNIVTFSVSLDADGEPVLSGTASIRVPSKPTA